MHCYYYYYAVVPAVDYIISLTVWCQPHIHPGTLPGLSKYLWIPGYSDKGGCVCCMPIPVQSRDGQSISGSQDTLTRGVVCAVCPSRYNLGMVRVSLDPGYSDKGVVCVGAW